MEMEEIKKKLGQKATDFVKEGSIIGLGTGTTATHFIQSLAEKCLKGFRIKAVASSNESFYLAKKLKINLVFINEINYLDLYIDGADEVDRKKQMIKGRGGALLREKILASNSRKTLIMIDETKCVKKLGKVLLPVEVVPYGYILTKKTLEKLGYPSSLRKKDGLNLYLTDNNNYILDINLSRLLDNPKKDFSIIKSVPGVIEVGIFIDLADTLLIGQKSGEVKIV